jgi:hypothetical protein
MFSIKFIKVNNQLLVDTASLAFHSEATSYKVAEIVENHLADLVEFGDIGRLGDYYLLNLEHCQLILPLIAEGIELRKLQIKVNKAHCKAVRNQTIQTIAKWFIVGCCFLQLGQIAPKLINQITNPTTVQEQLAGEMEVLGVKDIEVY